ncbi:MAG: ADP-ribosylation factor-like protein [Candidatus Helarchaeota archaeon]
MSEAEEILIKKALLFLTEDVERPARIEELAELPCYYLREISDINSGKLRAVMNINNIKELAKVDIEQEKERIKMNGWKPFEFERWVLAARVISRIANYEVTSGKKITLLGLDNAGKTAIRETILRKYKGNPSVFQKMIRKLQPTKGVERETLSILDDAIQLWDMGGQEIYRRNYLNEPERYLLDIDVIIYVIDVQDSKKHNQAIEYLRSLATTFKALNQTVYFLVCYHKFDPDLQDAQRYREWIDNSWKVISMILDDLDYPRTRYITSIYEDITIFKVFSDALMLSADFRVEKILRGILAKFADEAGLSNLILLDDNGLLLGKYIREEAVDIAFGERLYKLAIQTINSIRQINAIDQSMDTILHVKSVHYTFFANNKNFSMTKILLLNKSIYLAFMDPVKNQIEFKFTRTLIPWLSNLFI